MAAAIPFIPTAISVVGGLFGRKKQQPQTVSQQTQAQPSPTPQEQAQGGQTVGGVRVPQLPTSATQDYSNAVRTGAQQAQRVRRQAVAAQPRRPKVPNSSALRAPSLVGQ